MEDIELFKDIPLLFITLRLLSVPIFFRVIHDFQYSSRTKMDLTQSLIIVDRADHIRTK